MRCPVDDGVVFALLGAAMGFSTLALAAVRLGKPPSTLVMAGYTPAGNAWNLDPDRRDPELTWWRWSCPVPCPDGRLLAVPADDPPEAWRELLSRFGQRVPEPPVAPDPGPPAWRILADRPGGAACLAHLGAWPAAMRLPTVVWDASGVQVFAGLPPDDHRVPDLVMVASVLADAGWKGE